MSDNQFDFGPAAKQIESLKGAANGLASLGSNGLVPGSQLPGATQSAAGLMSAADKTKLDGIATGATANVVSDSLSDTSTTNALSAAKGKALNDSITALNTQIANLIKYEDFEYTTSANGNVEFNKAYKCIIGITCRNKTLTEAYIAIPYSYSSFYNPNFHGMHVVSDLDGMATIKNTTVTGRLWYVNI